MKFRKPFRAVPLRDRQGNVIPFREERRGKRIKGSDGNGAHGPRQSIPLRSRKAVPRKPRRSQRSEPPMRKTGFVVLVIAVFLIGFGVTLRFGDSLPAIDDTQRLAAPVASASDNLSARFTSCDGPNRVDCVVDGDTFWMGGDKIRILDINTPETSSPNCDREYRLGLQATARLTELLNAGPFSLESGPENTDRYGRLLRRVTRGGQSLGEILIDEGLAERWRGYKGNWC